MPGYKRRLTAGAQALSDCRGTVRARETEERMGTETIKGYVEHIVFRNAENGYTVLSMTAGENEEVTAVGMLPEIGEGELISAQGVRSVHPTYGDQFRIHSFEILPPENAAAMERYLGSGIIKGIGQALAHRIVKKFGEETFRIIDQEPERLSQIKGISERKAREIVTQIFEKRGQRDGMLFLGRYGIPNALAIRIYKQYGAQIYQIIRENPYKLADELTGVGFKTADEIARKAGFQADSHFRVTSALLYVLQETGGEGNIYLPKTLLLQRTGDLLQLGMDAEWDSLMEECLENLIMEKKAVMKDEEGEIRVYAANVYYTELRCARMLNDLNVAGQYDIEASRQRVLQAQEKTGTTLDEKQMEAVMEADHCGLLVLTGGPGTGKTTTINTMISVFESEGLSIALAAPTGRAAKRMSEATGFEARTIHRLLEVNGDPERGLSFGKTAEDPLEPDVIIIDEMSMVDIYLLHALLSAVTIGTHLVMVGDSNQLPSVGPGSVLKDIIESGTIRVVTLTKIFRQAQESDIVVNAHKIHAGVHPQISNRSRDFFFMKETDPNKIIGLTIKLVRDNLPRYVHAPVSDIQVMAPMKKGLIGVGRLNQLMQQYLNPEGGGRKEHMRGDTLFREKDRVMQVKNNYQIPWDVRGRHGAPVESGEGVFNGDMGIIREINDISGTITVEFDEHRCVEYGMNDLDQLELAYAVTIHKAQGSEYPAVVIPLLRGPRMLMNRNLLYTAITRAKRCVVLIGDPDVMNEMIDNVSEARRFTTLALRLKECSMADSGVNPDDPFAGWED